MKLAKLMTTEITFFFHFKNKKLMNERMKITLKLLKYKTNENKCSELTQIFIKKNFFI